MQQPCESAPQINLYDVKYFAAAPAEAERLIKNRNLYFEALYEDISPALTYINEEEGVLQTRGNRTESMALMIIDQKQGYDRRIKSLQWRQECWESVLADLNDEDRFKSIQAFQQEIYFSDSEIDMLLDKLAKPFSKMLEEREKCKRKAHQAELKKYRELESLWLQKEGKKLTDPNEGKRQYFLKGRFVYLTEAEIETYENMIQKKANEAAFAWGGWGPAQGN
ncbi:hypothetical protein [Jeotgalibacillus proteolyticus]|uniref:Uncharacterized protein n=1 Tax=Jeotgalibacillus proteolyticus TaxID=2082395 RepID=A0A2S5GB34_9BACL|nr:hypothetical protein [Jeotgalibacillus proteolyticus]PPA70178.1 hypothetical protein C4B60_11365 [Jeotgalibacillus proteolyticus]